MKKQILIQFGKRVREERNKQGLSQEKLAEKVRVHRTYEKVRVHRTYVGMIERAEKISL
jgi:transcriptional regulator with XRE-family HTH domain